MGLIKVNDFFDKVYLINLKRRPDKLKISTDLLNKLGIVFELFEGVDFCEGVPADYPNQPKSQFLINKPGAFGCLMSHIEIIKNAKKNNFDKILILEDDIAASENFINLFDQKVKDLPADWKLFYLGGSGHTGENEHNVTTKITEHISETTGTYTTSSYGVSSSLYDTILNKWDSGGETIDQIYVWRIQKQSNHACYTVRPNIMWQRACFSDIAQAHRDYEGFMKELK
jgi:GR25 family glycosyltransferase involved in LPS biosynthesis